MTRIKIKTLLWDDWNTEHIKKHSVTVPEVEIAAKNIFWHKKAKNGRYLAGGRSGKRILSLIVRRMKRATYYLVTARDADKKERRRLYERKI